MYSFGKYPYFEVPKLRTGQNDYCIKFNFKHFSHYNVNNYF